MKISKIVHKINKAISIRQSFIFDPDKKLKNILETQEIKYKFDGNNNSMILFI